MGYDDLDRALIEAWQRAQAQLKDDPEALARVMRRREMAAYARPLRSWALVLRANDKRLPNDPSRGEVVVDAEAVGMWCSPVCIRYPGVSLDAAAGLFGVNRTTVARWASPADCTWWRDVKRQMQAFEDDSRFGRPSVYRVVGRRLVLEHEHNRANVKRSVTRVWTPGFDGLDAGGEVWSGDWGRLRVGLADRVPEGFEQRLVRLERGLGGGDGAKPQAARVRVLQWVCPQVDGGCGRLVYKLYLAMPNWTLLAALGGVAAPVDRQGLLFLCRRCAGLLYESCERSSSPGRGRGGGRRRVDVWDRFIKRISGGVLGGGDLQLCEEHLSHRECIGEREGRGDRG